MSQLKQYLTDGPSNLFLLFAGWYAQAWSSTTPSWSDKSCSSMIWFSLTSSVYWKRKILAVLFSFSAIAAIFPPDMMKLFSCPEALFCFYLSILLLCLDFPSWVYILAFGSDHSMWVVHKQKLQWPAIFYLVTERDGNFQIIL